VPSANPVVNPPTNSTASPNREKPTNRRVELTNAVRPSLRLPRSSGAFFSPPVPFCAHAFDPHIHVKHAIDGWKTQPRCCYHCCCKPPLSLWYASSLQDTPFRSRRSAICINERDRSVLPRIPGRIDRSRIGYPRARKNNEREVMRAAITFPAFRIVYSTEMERHLVIVATQESMRVTTFIKWKYSPRSPSVLEETTSRTWTSDLRREKEMSSVALHGRIKK